MEVKGTLKLVNDTQQITDKFRKREFVVATQEQYAQFITMELQGDNCDVIDAYAEGEEIVVSINLRGRMWTNKEGEDKYFNTIVAWKIQRANSTSAPSPQTQNSPQDFPQANQSNSFADDQDPPF